MADEHDSKEHDGKVVIQSSNTPPKAVEEEKAPAAKAAAQPSAPAKMTAADIKPKKRSFHWYTPFIWANDFIQGTVNGFGDGLSMGARKGFKYGVIAAVALFLLPLVPGVAGVFMSNLPGLVMGTMETGLFIPNGLGAIVAGLGYGLAGSAIGAAVAGTVGLFTGGARELQLRGRKEKYAEELAERDEMRAQQQARAPEQNRSNWRDYARAHRDYENQRQFKWFVTEHRRLPEAQGGWADQIEQERMGAHSRGR